MQDITEMLGCQYPIIQGAIHMATSPELAAAVSEAGGFGLLAGAVIRDTDELQAQIDRVKGITSKPFGANLVAYEPKSHDFAQVLVDNGVKAVTTSAGNPKQLIPRCKNLGLTVFNVSPSVDGAKKVESLGADAIIAEGTESGGMQGFHGASTMVLVPMVVDAVSVPVVAAGGIADARGYRAAFALGAKGVQAGTCFLASKECIAHELYKEAILEANEADTRLVNLGPMQTRALHTPLVERILEGETRVGFQDLTPEKVTAAWVDGDLEAFPISAGQVSGMIKEVRSVRKIIEGIVAE